MDSEVQRLLAMHEAAERVLAHVSPEDDSPAAQAIRTVAREVVERLRELGEGPLGSS
jgi:hypothetical protein